ncbi:hypothetical protein [Halomarina litorea]|uniref:hypothetical protein n=1 Tax=Halomarina litorea TaxID=2961595 RepID=UPI0020C301B6|nr:hypothetical protein [Halomarina sp. BCD28]
MTHVESAATVQILSIAAILLGELAGVSTLSTAGALAFALALVGAFVVMTFDLARGTRDWARLSDHVTVLRR